MGHFRTQSSTFCISVAPTGRARCRVCKKLVEKGAVRMVTRAFVRPGRRTNFVRHMACVDPMFAHAIMAVHGTVECVPVGKGVDKKELERSRGHMRTVLHGVTCID